MVPLHDWLLKSINIEWSDGVAALHLIRVGGGGETIVAHGLKELSVPRQFEWGPSIYINEVDGPSALEGALQEMKIEMQPGDVIRIVASAFDLPDH